MINRIHILSIRLLFCPSSVTRRAKRARRNAQCLQLQKNYLQAIRDKLTWKSFVPDCPLLKPVLTCKQYDVETQTLKRQEDIVSEERNWKFATHFISENLHCTWKHILIPESPQYPSPKSFYSRVFWFKTSFTKFTKFISEETSHRVVKSSDKNFESFFNLSSSCSRS